MLSPTGQTGCSLQTVSYLGQVHFLSAQVSAYENVFWRISEWGSTCGTWSGDFWCLHCRDSQRLELGFLGAQSVPEWPRLAPGSSNICLPSSHSSGQQPALCRAGMVMLVGLLSLLRAEVSTVARLSFVSCVSQDFFFLAGK